MGTAGPIERYRFDGKTDPQIVRELLELAGPLSAARRPHHRGVPGYVRSAHGRAGEAHADNHALIPGSTSCSRRWSPTKPMAARSSACSPATSERGRLKLRSAASIRAVSSSARSAPTHTPEPTCRPSRHGARSSARAGGLREPTWSWWATPPMTSRALARLGARTVAVATGSYTPAYGLRCNARVREPGRHASGCCKRCSRDGRCVRSSSSKPSGECRRGARSILAAGARSSTAGP